MKPGWTVSRLGGTVLLVLHADEGDQATGKRKDGSWGIDLALVLSDAERAQLLADLQAPENVRREISPAQSLIRRGDRS